jgi:hypothetical protein
MNTVRIAGPAGTYEVPVHRAPLSTRFLQGAGLAGGLTALRLVPGIGKSFSLAQVLVGLAAVSLGGGVGGVVYYATDHLRVRGGMSRTFANVISLLVYCLATFGLLMLLGSMVGLE